MSTSRKFKNLSKTVKGWVIYDWANSAFATTVMAGFFPVFFKQYWSAGADVNLSTAQLGFANSIASGIIFISAPILGAIADKSSAKKKLLITFAYLGALMTAGLFLVGQGDWQMAILVYIVGTIGFSGANIFYDAMINDIAREDEVDYISGLGYSAGYLGGGLLFLINVLMTLYPAWFGLADAAMAVRVSFLTVALWWGGFTLFTIFWVQEAEAESKVESWFQATREGFAQLFTTLRKVFQIKTLLLFLVAYFFYIDGVHTIIRMAVDYGLSIGFKDTDLIAALLLVQFIGFPAAVLYARFGERWGVRRALLVAIVSYMLITLWGTQITQTYQFYVLAVFIGLFQGGIQALSRSYYSRLVPPGMSGEFFGFYNMVGKFSTIVGPVLMGTVGLMIKNYLVENSDGTRTIVELSQQAARWSIASLVILFLLGAWLLYNVDEEKGKEQALQFKDSHT